MTAQPNNKGNDPGAVNRRHLAGFKKIQLAVLKALKDGVPPREYKPLAAAYKDAVSGERLVLGMGGGQPEKWPEEMVVRWVDDDERPGENG